MNAILVEIKKNKQLGRVVVRGDVFCIGRSKECDLLIGDDAGVSGKHAIIKRKGDSFWIEDCSTNGTALNGKKIKTATPLNDGDEIGMGGHLYRFLQDEVSNGQEAPVSAARTHSVPAGKGSMQMKLRAIEGSLQGQVFENLPEPVTLGKAVDNSVVLMDDEFASEHHARITCDGRNFFIEDLKSTNGTFVNKRKVVQRTKLHNGHKIKLSETMLVFELRDLAVVKRRLTIAAVCVAGFGLAALLVNLLRPPDVAGQHILAARKYMAARNWAAAIKEYETALSIEPHRAETGQELNNARKILQGAQQLDQAEAKIAALKYEEAAQLIDSVLHDFPKSARGRSLQDELKILLDARTAFNSRQWESAITLLEKGSNALPESSAIRGVLQKAQREKVALVDFQSATASFEQRQFLTASNFFNKIPPGSVYAGDSARYCAWMEQEQQIDGYVLRAQARCQKGPDQECLQLISQAIAEAVKMDDPHKQLIGDRLARRKEQLEKILNLKPSLPESEQMASGRQGQISELLLAAQTCDTIGGIVSEPDDIILTRAQRARTELGKQLALLSKKAMTNGYQLSGRTEASSRRDAVRQFELAAQADTSNKEALDKAVELRRSLREDCLNKMRRARAAEQYEPKTAIESYTAVTQMGMPDEDYYSQARQMLSKLQQ